MRLSTNLINELVTELAGHDTVRLVDFLYEKINVSEFKLADALTLTVNQVRNLLYRLDEHNLVASIRKKDKQKGWYEYYWTLDLVRMRHTIIERNKEKIARLNASLKEEEQKHYYYCPNTCMRVGAEEALELRFKCPECDSIFKQEDSAARKDKMQQEIKKLEANLQEAKQAVEVQLDLEAEMKRKKRTKKKVPLQKAKSSKKQKKQKQRTTKPAAKKKVAPAKKRKR
jgi:transcription initiation factor TFIIE subunit alpha